MKTKCKHKNLGHVQTIEAYHQTIINEEGKPEFNNEYGGNIRDQVDCFDCKKRWIVTKSSPKFVTDFHNLVNHLRDTRM